MPESSDRLRCNYKLAASGVQGVKSPEGTATGSFVPADFFRTGRFFFRTGRFFPWGWVKSPEGTATGSRTIPLIGGAGG